MSLIIFLAVWALIVAVFVWSPWTERFTDPGTSSGTGDNRGTIAALSPVVPSQAVQPTYAQQLPDNPGPHRPCAIYYGEPANVDNCDKYQYWYTLPREALTARIDVSDTFYTAEEKAAARSILAEVASALLPGASKNICKLQFDTPWANGVTPTDENSSWSEPSTSVDGVNSIRKKVVKDPRSMANGDPLNWGHCYHKLMSGQTRANVMPFADGTYMINTPNMYSPYKTGDPNTYAELTFSSFKWEDLSSDFKTFRRVLPPVSKTGDPLPSYMFSFKLDGAGPTPKITAVDILQTDKTTTDSTKQLTSMSADIKTQLYAQLYQKKLNRSSTNLELVPAPLVPVIWIVYYDEAGRISQVDKRPMTQATLTLGDIAQMKAPPAIFNAPAACLEVGNKEYDAIRSLFRDLTNTYTSQTNAVSTAAAAVPTSYINGMVVSEYACPTNFLASLVNGVTEASAFDAVLNPLRQNGPKAGSPYVIKGVGFASSIANSVKTTGGNATTYYEYVGYIKAPVSGTYYFNIAYQGAAADMLVNGTIDYANGKYTISGGTCVAGVYGRVLMDSVGVTYSAGTYIPIRIRAYVHDGIRDTILLSWNRGDPNATYSLVLLSDYYYNPGLANYAASFSAEQDTITKLGCVSDFIQGVPSGQPLKPSVKGIDVECLEVYNTTPSKLIGNWFMQGIYKQSYMSGINPNDISARYVYMSFDNVGLSSTSVLPENLHLPSGGYPLVDHFTAGRETFEDAGMPLPANLDVYKTPVVYTVFVRLWIDQESDNTRNVFLIGDTTTPTATTDQAPALFVQPSSKGSVMSLNHTTNRRSDIGELGYYTWHPTTFGYWFVYTAVVNRDTITMYYNGDNAYTTTLPVGEEFVWNYNHQFVPSNKKVYLNYLNSTSRADDRLQMRDFQWFDTALEQPEINKIAATILATPSHD